MGLPGGGHDFYRTFVLEPQRGMPCRRRGVASLVRGTPQERKWADAPVIRHKRVIESRNKLLVKSVHGEMCGEPGSSALESLGGL